MDELTRSEFDRVADENSRQNHRIDILEKKVEQVHEVALSIKELTINMKHMLEAQTAMQRDLEELKAAPGQNWNKAVWIVGTALLSGVVGYALKAIGL